MTKCGIEEDGSYVSISRGGPIYVPELISPLTDIPTFQQSLIEQIHNLQEEIEEIRPDPSGLLDEDFSVEELKIFSHEELVNKAIEEAFKDDKSILALENPDCDAREVRGGTSLASRSDCNPKKKPKTGCAIEGDYMKRVEQLARVKQRQDEDKAAVRLCSFKGTLETKNHVISPSEKAERKKSLMTASSKGKVKASCSHDFIPVSSHEVVLCVELYHTKKPASKTQELLFLGCQMLTDLRDSIYCLTDEIMHRSGVFNPSAYFLIEDVFLNDMRDSAAVDLSKPVFDWINEHEDEAVKKWQCILSGRWQEKHIGLLADMKASKLPSFRSARMEKTRFHDLRFRIGASYLYCHHGDCKHVFVIRDMRLIHADDPNNRALYPIMTYQLKVRVQKCSVCRIYKASKMTVDDKWAQENPCYFCDKCYFLLHYSEDGNLLYNEFSVYDCVC